MTYSTQRLSQLASRAPSDAQLRAEGRARGANVAPNRIASLARYCERRASMYSRAEDLKLALAYANFAEQLRLLVLAQQLDNDD